MRRIYTEYTKNLHGELRDAGIDVSKLDGLRDAGYQIFFVGSHLLTPMGAPGISGSHCEHAGTYEDNDFEYCENWDFLIEMMLHENTD